MVNGISQISVNHNKTKLAYTMDSGVVGIVDLSTKTSSRMKVKHANVSPQILYVTLTFIQRNRSDGLSNLSPTDLAKYSAADTTVPSFILMSCKVVYSHD